MSTSTNACHCGEPIIWHNYDHPGPDGFRGAGSLTRNLCEHCDTVRCDAYPGECGRRDPR